MVQAPEPRARVNLAFRLKRSTDWELLNRGSVLPYTVVLHACSLLAKSLCVC